MFAGPPAVEPTERARAEVTEHAERIYDETKRGVDAEIDRLDAAKAWAIAEMDRVTAEAIRRLDAGGDPEAVERWTQEQLAATIERASAAGFDPRPPKSAAPTPHPAVVVPVAASPRAEIASPTPTAAPAPEVAVPEVAAGGQRSCACAGSPSGAAAWWAPWMIAAWLRRRRP